jgi:hypothetical protein
VGRKVRPAATSAPDADQVEADDTRSAREKIIDHLTDTVEQGPQHVLQIVAGTGLSRALVDPVLCRAAKNGQIERAGGKGEATYRLMNQQGLAPSIAAMSAC